MARKKQKIALITGVTGQDGAYLADFLLRKNYKVFGTFRRISSPNFWRLDHIGIKEKIKLIPCDLMDEGSIIEALKISNPDEIYNLAAQSFVGASFSEPIATGQISGLSVLRILEMVRLFKPKAKFYQASTSEMFGGRNQGPINERTHFYPKSPYGTAKLYAHWTTINYREAYNLFACCGILFNHESPIRGQEFATRKITMGVAKIKLGQEKKLLLGNLDAKRDWGYAPDYVECMWLMLQQKKPEDFIIATGETRSVREFAREAFSCAGLDYRQYVGTDKRFLRPSDVPSLLGDSSKAQKKLQWNPRKTSFKELVKSMVDSDLKRLRKGAEMIF